MSRLEVIEASTTKQISDCLKIREEVFINEQGVPKEEELDELDNSSFHALAYLDSVPLATGRLLNISKDYFIYALDGQHRLLGVKGLQTLADKGSITFGKKNQDLSTVTGIDDYPVSNINRILNEKISIEFVVGVKKDETRSEAKERVRTLFVDHLTPTQH